MNKEKLKTNKEKGIRKKNKAKGNIRYDTDKAISASFFMTETIKGETKKMLDVGIIERSNSPYMSPVVLVKKPDQTFRFCIDFRNLYKLTVFDAEPIPIPEEIFSKLSNCKYFTKIDLSKEYWQIKLSENSRDKTAFSTPEGLFQFRKLPFGLVTAPANFSRMMRLLLKGLIDIDNFIDDILEHTVEWNDHLVKLKELLQRLRQSGLTARPSKCMIGFTSIEFLGHKVGGGVLTPNQDKVNDIVVATGPETKSRYSNFWAWWVSIESLYPSLLKLPFHLQI